VSISKWYRTPAAGWQIKVRRNIGGVHLGTVHNRGLESPRNPQAGKPALRSADIPVRGFGRLSSRPMIPARASRPRTVPGCAPQRADESADCFLMCPGWMEPAAGEAVTVTTTSPARFGFSVLPRHKTEPNLVSWSESHRAALRWIEGKDL
jgi:hypothetical protein